MDKQERDLNTLIKLAKNSFDDIKDIIDSYKTSSNCDIDTYDDIEMYEFIFGDDIKRDMKREINFIVRNLIHYIMRYEMRYDVMLNAQIDLLDFDDEVDNVCSFTKHTSTGEVIISDMEAVD
jgi:hypothetical protein